MTIPISLFKYKDHDFMDCSKSKDSNHKFIVSEYGVGEYQDENLNIINHSTVKEVLCSKCLMRIKINDALYFGSAANEIIPASNDEGPIENE